MKLEHLQLENFRGFESLALPFDPSFTLLLGANGAGKTAVLEGAAVALAAFSLGLPEGPSRNITQDDARLLVFEHDGMPDLQAQWPVRVEARGALEGNLLTWARELAGASGRTTRQEATAIRLQAERIAKAVRRGKPRDLPVLAYYGTQRLWLQKRVTSAKKGVGSRFDGYIDCLDPASNHRLLSEWMYKQTLVELQRGAKSPQMAAVADAVCTCVGGARRFWFSVAYEELQIELQDGRVLPLSVLSDGYRNMVAMVADIAWRAAVLNPQLGVEACTLAEGVVLIDEIDLHLHPAWQRRIVPDLLRTFPKLQFIATSHSPQVLSSVRREEVRILRDNALVTEAVFVEGRDTNGLLEDVFGVPARPEEAQAKVDALFRLIDDEDYDAARAALAELEEMLGPDDSAIVRARWMLDTEAREPEAG
jgi:predicted ATP-binding protein involved in virulence